PPDEVTVEGVQGLAGVHPGPDGIVDLARREGPAGREVGTRDDRLPLDLRRVVALVGHALELVSQPERVDDLGGGGDQGDDLHRGRDPSWKGLSKRSPRSRRALPASAPSSSRRSKESESV